MQAIPSVTPLSRTAFCTSSVMSVTVSPPAVRRRVSCWNTFMVVAILRESLPDPGGEPSNPQWILQRATRDSARLGEDEDDRAEPEENPDRGEDQARARVERGV